MMSSPPSSPVPCIPGGTTTTPLPATSPNGNIMINTTTASPLSTTSSSCTASITTTSNSSAASTPTHNNINNSAASAAASSTNGAADNQQFCLRWNNYQSNLTQVFEQLLENESFVDVTLACERRNIKAHRMVLSACSPYFQSILKEAADSTHPVIILQGVKYSEMKAVIDFMYKGEINVSQDHLAGLLRVAETLKIRGLTEVGEGDEAEAVLTSPSSPRPRLNNNSSSHNNNNNFGSEDLVSRKRRRFSGDDSHHHSHHTRSRSSSPNASSPTMAMDFLDATLEPMLSQNSRSSVSNQSSTSATGGVTAVNINTLNNSSSNNSSHSLHHNSASPTASLASSLSSLAAHLPGAMPPPGHPMAPLPPHLAQLPHLSPLSPLLNMHHPAIAARHHQAADDFEIRPGIAEMIREEERVRYQFNTLHCYYFAT